MTPSPFVKIKEAAKLLSVSRTTVRGLIDCGDLSVATMSPSRSKKRIHVRISRVSLDRFIAKRSM